MLGQLNLLNAGLNNTHNIIKSKHGQTTIIIPQALEHILNISLINIIHVSWRLDSWNIRF